MSREPFGEVQIKHLTFITNNVSVEGMEELFHHWHYHFETNPNMILMHPHTHIVFVKSIVQSGNFYNPHEIAKEYRCVKFVRSSDLEPNQIQLV